MLRRTCFDFEGALKTLRLRPAAFAAQADNLFRHVIIFEEEVLKQLELSTVLKLSMPPSAIIYHHVQINSYTAFYN